MQKHLNCSFIDYGINFAQNDIKVCCKSVHANKGTPFVCDVSEFTMEKLIKRKKELKDKLFNGIIPEECENCPYIFENDYYDENMVIGIIDINSSVNCNCKCIYCNYHKMNKAFKEKSIYGILKKLIEEKSIKKVPGGYVQIAGGEPTIMKDFDKIIDLFIKKSDIDLFVVQSNAIKYSKKIEQLLNKKKTRLVISIDSGSKEIYEKIKQVPCFDKVVKNIAQYIKNNKNPESSVRVKFIFIPGINDTEEEVLKWYNLSLMLGAKILVLDIDAVWYMNHNREVPENVQKLIKLIQEKCQTDNITLDYYESLRSWNPEFIRDI